MAKYIALHTLKKSAEEVSEALNDGAPEFARAMATGEIPCKCLKTQNPLPYGRTDYFFCLWEAEKPEDIEETIRALGFLEYVTLDTMQVDEVDWEELAKAGGQSKISQSVQCPSKF